MKITIKSLKQQIYEIEDISEDLTIKDLKSEIEKKYKFDSESIKLLFKSSMLDNSKKIKDCNITESDNLVMMNPKVKPQNISTNNEDTSKINEIIKEEKKISSEILNSNSKEKEIQKEKEKEIQKEKKINKFPNETKNLTELGFNESQALLALEKTNGNLQEAIENIFNEKNFGENFQLENLENENEDSQNSQEVPLTFEIDPKILDTLDLKDPNAIKTISSFVKILISEDSSSLQILLEDIEETNPEIIEFIKENEDEFKRLIAEPLNEKDLEGFLPANNQNISLIRNLIQGKENENNEEDEFEENENNNEELNLNLNEDDGHTLISLSQFNDTEKEGIERLMNLGFGEQEVIQAFIACEKNEMLTANFLLESKFKDNEGILNSLNSLIFLIL